MQSTNPGPAQRDTAIVFLAHVWSESVAKRFERLRRETAPLAECFLLLQDDGGDVVRNWRGYLATIGAPDALVTFNDLTLPAELGHRYFGMQRVMANTHFPLLQFARSRRYAYYWQVEFDVEYRGSWHDFFAAYTQTDASLLAMHFHTFVDWPEWCWWPSLTLPPGIDLLGDKLYKCFLPVMRLSRAAVDTIEQSHRQGWMGHFEAVLPTSLLLAGHRLEDLNVRQACYAGVYQDACGLLAVQSTVRCRPFISLGEFCNRGQGPLLFHPVKEPWTFDGTKVVVCTPAR